MKSTLFTFAAAAASTTIGFAQELLTIRPTSTQMWIDEKVDIRGSVSPDGRYISFTERDTGDLVIRDIASGHKRRIAKGKNTSRGQLNAWAVYGTFSRDGAQVAYRWSDWSDPQNVQEGMGIAHLEDDPPTPKFFSVPNANWIMPRDWSPDGKWVAAFIVLKDRTHELALISVADGSVRQLRSGLPSVQSRAFFSPDGRYVGYNLPQGHGPLQDIWVTATDGAGDTLVIKHRDHDVMMGWSPDGKLLLFGSDRAGSLGLWRIPISNGIARGAPELITPSLGLAVSMGMTQSGALFYATYSAPRGGSLMLGSFDSNSGQVSSLRDVSAVQEDNMTPNWSPDGRYLAYGSERGIPGTSTVIVIRPIDSETAVRELRPKLRAFAADNTGLAGWEPNGRGLLVMGQDFQGRRGAFRVDVETGETKFLLATSAIPGLWPVWSRDGRSLFYFRRVAGSDVFLRRDIDSGKDSEVIRRSSLGAIRLSPEGDYICTTTVDPSKNETVVLLIPLRGGEPRELMRVGDRDKGVGINPNHWTADSRHIIARRTHARESEGELWQIPVDGGAPRKLDFGPEPHVFAFKPSPDGRMVAYRQKDPEREPSPQVWKLENFLTTTDSAR